MPRRYRAPAFLIFRAGWAGLPRTLLTIISTTCRSRIPNYCLVECHNENRELFSGITRIRLRDIPQAMKCILWDMRARRIIAMAEYRQQGG